LERVTLPGPLADGNTHLTHPSGEEAAPRWRSPENVFLLLALLFGFAFVAVVPPLDPPDENYHLARAFLLSEGRLSVPGTAPGYEASIPRSLVALHAPRDHREFSWRHHVAEIVGSFGKPLEPDSRVSVYGVVLYSPVVYAAPAMVMATGRSLGLSAAALLYLGRIANLVIWVAATWLAIRLAPCRKWTVTVLSLTPMSLSLAASLSADPATNAVALLLLVAVARTWVPSAAPLSYSESFGFVALGTLLGLVKAGYWPLAALVLLIPPRRFDARWQYPALLLATALCMAISTIVWIAVVRAADPPPTPGADPAQQLALILDHPLAFLGVVVSTFANYGLLFGESFVGILGHLVVVLPSAVYVAYGGLLAATAAIERNQLEILDARKRAFLLLVFVGTTIVAMTMGYVGWTPVGAPQVYGFQGRYFAPLVPLLFVAVPALPKRWWPVQEPRARWVASGCAVILAIAVLETARYFFLPPW
jgi:uncharacterized membrane protein